MQMRERERGRENEIRTKRMRCVRGGKRRKREKRKNKGKKGVNREKRKINYLIF
jgi:hypothetical protein